MKVAKLTWFGLALALLGWTGLIGGALLANGALSALEGSGLGGFSGLPRPEAARIDLLSGHLVFTGLALAILGAVQAGSGTLNTFFQAVLERSTRPKPHAPAEVRPDPGAIIERGRLGDRSFIRYRDGSVDVETMLGVRRFASMDEAQEFVGT